MSRLLTPSIVARREIARDTDEWSIRLAALATLGQYDALTLVVDGGARDRYACNLADDPTGDSAIRSAIEETRRSGATVQTQTTIRLADDRVTGSAMVAPLVATDAISGVLIALRVGRSFAAADALTASGVSELVSLELAREALAGRDDAHGRQAYALYELARLALFGERLLETLQDVTVLLTSALGHDIAQVWLFEPGGALELSAAKPRENLRFEQMNPSDHDALAQALHQRRLVRIGQGALRPWVPADTRELIVVPLAIPARTLGALLLGRTDKRYDEADEELAGVLGRFIGRVISRATTVDAQRMDGAAEGEPDREWADEPQLTGS
ncbi:MAG: GAF domain-containing protein [Chloroflexota bacterium]|nr:GAF domain-containing protein [Chloroflexota bacterium]